MVAFASSPLLISFWCATSRLVDNWHHPSDIIAGSILGMASSLISYHMWFPHVFAVYAGIPLSVVRRNGDDNPKIGSDYILVEKQLSLPVYSGHQ